MASNDLNVVIVVDSSLKILLKLPFHTKHKSLIDQPEAAAQERSFIIRENFSSWHCQSYSSVSKMVARLCQSKVRSVVYTDFWEADEKVIPTKRHQAVGKETGKTSYIERLNCTFRQRISRLVRRSLSFSKKGENHIGAIWYFVHHYNSSLLV